MKIVDGKIAEATKSELFNYWLTCGYDDIYSFPEFLERMKKCGVVIKEEDDKNAKF